MKKLLFLILFFACFINAQNQANWWFFGSNAGLDFNSGSPVANDLGQLDTTEGCATISDACGNLLFYTDGITIWNRNHQVMLNGSGLLGDPSSTQSGIIIPMPENENLYYIFTVGDFNPVTGLNYSVVDMLLDNGLGAVIPSQKNINLLPDSSEKVTASVHSNGRDAWIISYAESNFNTGIFDSFYAFKLTPQGLDNNVIVSNSPSTRVEDRRGYLKIAPDGSKIALMNQFLPNGTPANNLGTGAFIFDFDTTNGSVTNPTELSFPSNLLAYGGEFSLDSRLFYLDLNTAQNGVFGERTLLQYDTTSPNYQSNPITIYQTDPLDSTDDVSRGALQIGPDGKIYYSNDLKNYLSVIDQPNNIGASAAFILNGVSLAPGTNVNEGLPPFYNAFFTPRFSFVEGCSGNPTQFTADALATCPNTTLLWDFGDTTSSTNTSTVINPTHTFVSPGDYQVSLTITTPLETFTIIDTITVVNQPNAGAINDIIVCDDLSNDGLATIDFSLVSQQVLQNNTSNNLEISLHYNLFEAQQDFNSIAPNTQLTAGTYYVRLDNLNSNGCYDVTSFEFNVVHSLIANPIQTQYTCDIGNDGIETIDFTQAASEILGSQNPIDFDVSFYSSNNDAQNRINELPYFHILNATNSSFYARIENRDFTSCFEIISFDFELIEEPQIPFINDYEVCDDNSRDGIEIFDLTAIRDQILSSIASNWDVSFHPDQASAVSNSNALPDNYQNTQAIEQIYIRLANNGPITCIDTQPFTIVVNEKPVITVTDPVVTCPDDEVTLTASNNFDSYLWNNGETTRSITTTLPGIYSVTGIDNNGCTDSISTSIAHYDLTQLESIEIEQFTIRSNSIKIDVTGDGPWQYSIDNFIFQDSPVFTNLLPGFYTITVRSQTNCNTLTVPATIVAAPPYFTPNEDGFHDYWQVTAIETEPDASIYIFDRFGKLLKQLDPLGVGWDGTYNNNPMPSTDYWYLVELADGRSFKGHFSLIR
ncbi:T9SS type B sorting domain-containing protein [Nonlabens sp. SCSIO 43208]|uniref:T9SS type B sorting domain-containing protein n=1 Tax=Nonlabens sp. SCSIO 43208 TaxID=2793009 RepID=UPI003D6A5F29